VLNRLQRLLGLQTIPGVFFTSAGIAVLFVALAIPFDEAVAGFFGGLTAWVARNLGWFYIVTVSFLLVFLLGLALAASARFAWVQTIRGRITPTLPGSPCCLPPALAPF
jgi:hypothetical protein